MNTERKLNTPHTPVLDTKGRLAIAEAHAVACWAALERHVHTSTWGAKRYDLPPRCGCYKHDQAGHIVIQKSCEVGEACAEEYEIASRRVREIQAEQSTLEQGDFEAHATPDSTEGTWSRL